jgi:hypothetical protein
MRAINTDLFTGASASFGARAGALGGGVNFTTLQPTQTWQSRLGASYGSFDKYNWSIGETGSIGKLGIAVMTTKRGGNNPLTFRDYEDLSGQTYEHGGEMTNAGDYVKLRYELTDNTNVLFTALQNNQGVASLCTQFTAALPCGTGPNNTANTKYQFMYGTIQSLIGQTAVSVTGYTSSQLGFTNDIDRTIDQCIGQTPSCPQAEPYSADTNALTRGVAATATITQGKHTITFNGSTFASVNHSTPLVAAGTSAYVTPATNAVSAGTYQIVDSYKVNDRLSIGPTASLASTTGAGTSILGGVSGSWRPNDNDTISASVSVGSSQPGSNIQRSYSDPQSARVDCAAETAMVSGPGDQPTKQSAIDYELNFTHQWSHGQLTMDAYRQTQAGQLISAMLPAGSAPGTLPPGYVTAVNGYYSTVCPVGSVTPSVYITEPVNGTSRLYQGYDITTRLGLGRDVTVIPSYSVNQSIYTGADTQFLVPGSTLVLDSQIFGRPMHRGNFTIDAYNPPTKLELIANAQYVGVNNNQHLAPYVNFSAGISRPLGIGQLTLFETNMFNTETALFSTLLYSVPEPLAGGGSLPVAANPLAPRTIQLSYSFNTGAQAGAGFARRAGGFSRAAQSSATPAPSAPRGLGFGTLHFVAPPDGVDPLTLATSRTECTAELQPIAQKVLAQLGAAAKAYAAGATTLPAVDGIDVTPHGDRTTTSWYLALGPNIPSSLFRRRPQDQGQRGGGPGMGRMGGGPRGEGGEGGPTGGFQQQVTVGPNTQAPRPTFTPSPELIAALEPFRALASCSYATVLTPDEAKTRGFDVAPPGLQVAQRPEPSPSPAASAAPSPEPSGAPGRGRQRRSGFLNYAPTPGIFIVRAPQLEQGGGSLKK